VVGWGTEKGDGDARGLWLGGSFLCIYLFFILVSQGSG